VIVDNLDVLCACICPPKAYAPLIIDAHAVLSAAFTLQRLKVITRWNAEVFKSTGDL
jgi:hypothetical protein